jgi:ribosomal protein L32
MALLVRLQRALFAVVQLALPTASRLARPAAPALAGELGAHGAAPRLGWEAAGAAAAGPLGAALRRGEDTRGLRERAKGLLEELWEEGMLWAVPKKKRSKNVIRNRHFTQRVQPVLSKWTCDKCGKDHLPHHLCPWCFPFNNWTLKKHIPPPKRTYTETVKK